MIIKTRQPQISTRDFHSQYLTMAPSVPFTSHEQACQQLWACELWALAWTIINGYYMIHGYYLAVYPCHRLLPSICWSFNMFYAYLALFKTNSPFNLIWVDEGSVNVFVCMYASFMYGDPIF